MTVNRGQHPVATDVKLPILVQLWPLYVLLQNKSFLMILVHVSI